VITSYEGEAEGITTDHLVQLAIAATPQPS